MVAGAAAGLARYLGVEAMIVRIALAARLTGSAVRGAACGSGSLRLREDGGQQALVDRTTIRLNIVMGRFGFPSGRSVRFAAAAA
jgi:PspC domain